MEGDSVPKEDKREESSSFLKKRTKKLLSYVEPTGAQEEMWVLRRQAPAIAVGSAPLALM